MCTRLNEDDMYHLDQLELVKWGTVCILVVIRRLHAGLTSCIQPLQRRIHMSVKL